MKPEKIETLYAWVCTESDGGEGIPAIEMRGTMMPLIGADRDRIESLRDAALRVAGDGLPVKLVEFTDMKVLELILPNLETEH